MIFDRATRDFISLLLETIKPDQTFSYHSLQRREKNNIFKMALQYMFVYHSMITTTYRLSITGHLIGVDTTKIIKRMGTLKELVNI